MILQVVFSMGHEFFPQVLRPDLPVRPLLSSSQSLCVGLSLAEEIGA